MLTSGLLVLLVTFTAPQPAVSDASPQMPAGIEGAVCYGYDFMGYVAWGDGEAPRLGLISLRHRLSESSHHQIEWPSQAVPTLFCTPSQLLIGGPDGGLEVRMSRGGELVVSEIASPELAAAGRFGETTPLGCSVTDPSGDPARPASFRLSLRDLVISQRTVGRRTRFEERPRFEIWQVAERETPAAQLELQAYVREREEADDVDRRLIFFQAVCPGAAAPDASGGSTR